MSQSLEGDNSNCPTETFLFERNETRSSVSHSASIAMDDGGNFVNDENTDTCSSAHSTVECAGALPEKMTKLGIGCRIPHHSRKDETATDPPEVYVFGCNLSSFSSAQTSSKSNDRTTPEFCFQSKTGATSGYGAVPQTKVQDSYPFTILNNSCTFSTFENAVPAFSFGTLNAETETAPDDPFSFSVKHDLPGYSRETLFGLDSIKSAYKDKREACKGKMKNKRPTRLKQHAQLHQVISKEACTSGEASDLAGDCSPMDCSPYPAESEHVPTEAYVASDQPVHIGDTVISNGNTSCAEDDVVSAAEHLVTDADLLMFGDEGRGPKLDASESNFGSSVSSFEGDQSNASQHSFTNIGQNCNENTYRTPHDFVEAAAFQSNSSNFSGLNFRFGVSSSPQISAAAQRRSTRRKLRTKGSLASKPSTIDSLEQPKSSQDTKGMQFFCEASKNEDSVKAQQSRDSSTSVALETCETWRTSGNKAYANGHFTAAEDYYTRGINSVTHNGVSGQCSRALMLCYSNRAATRMSLGMMWEALQDCLTATSIDPTFLKAKVRAAKCQLALGDLEDASMSYMSCLNSNTESSDPKIFAEASDGLEGVKRVTDWVSQCKEFLERRTSPEATKALELISNALHICPHSDSVKEMKAEALLMLRRYEEVIQLCQESVNLTERNSVLFKDNGEPKNSRVSERMQFSGRYWRPYLICKSYFLSGKLDEALELLKKHEQVTPVKESEVNTYEEKFSSLSATIRELLSLKAAGNESFQAGRYSDAVKQYSAALAWNSESRPFSAVCFCNRAAAYQALGQVTDAISDCSLAMVLDTNYPKAISRRATLYKMIRDYDQAANDVRKLISLLEKKVNVSGVSPKAFNKHNDLKQAHVRLSSIEDEAKNDTPLNLYLILGVEPSCSSEDIKKAYRKAALRHHPDKATQLLIRNENAEDGFWRDVVKEVYADADHLFKTIGEAYNVLSDPAKREEYNFEEDLRNARRRVSSSRSMHRSPEQNYSNRGFNPRQRQSSRASRSRWYSNSDDYW
ncbi:Heat shock protein DnaJ with tetratricopeptide repeat [Zea mays]|nr:Heat shock protein DnaJ with tetratricopeptide repeat [Zea mays]